MAERTAVHDVQCYRFVDQYAAQHLQFIILSAEGATMMQIDHDKQTVWKEHFKIQGYYTPPLASNLLSFPSHYAAMEER